MPVLIEETFEALRSGSVLLKHYPVKVTFLDPVPGLFFGQRPSLIRGKGTSELDRIKSKSNGGLKEQQAEQSREFSHN